MALKLYDLCGSNPDLRFSPYCWRTKLALAQKGLACETIPWRFTEREAVGRHGSDKVPVLLDGDRAVRESWDIAEYLEDSYPDRPSLFGGEGGRALARFVNAWADGVVMAGLVRLVISDIPALLDPTDRDYFIASREARFGTSLDRVTADREQAVGGFRDSLLPLRLVLRRQPFLHGAAPGYADAAVFGPFQWARVVSPFAVLAPDDAVHAWCERMLDAHGGIARAMPARAA